MLTIETRGLLRQLRSGTFDIANAASLEPLSASAMISDLTIDYPVIFQERRIGKKREVGMARSLRFELAVRRAHDSLLARAFLLPVLWRCLFISSYEDSLSELTTIASIRAEAQGGASQDVVLKSGRGHKLDRTPDGWALKTLKRREVTLSESFLAKRGWRFDIMVPFHS